MSYSPQGINSGDVKINNRSLVLQLLFSRGPMSRSEIAEILGLTRATVTTISNDLFSQNLLVEKGEVAETGRAGRKKHLVNINFDCKHVLSINIHTAVTRLALCNLRGDEKDSRILRSESSIAPEKMLKLVAQACVKMLWDNQLADKDVLGVGVAVIGPVDHINGISLNAFELWDRPVPVRQILEHEMHLPVCVESNVCAMMETQLVYNDFSDKNVLAVKWGPGVGSAFVINGSIYKGKNFRSSELGHNMVANSNMKCRCGKTGCLETVVSTQAISDGIKKIAREDPESDLAKRIGENWRLTKTELNEILEIQDDKLQKYINSVIDQLATVISNAIQILAPDCVLCYGDLLDCDNFFNRFSKRLNSFNAPMDESTIKRILGGSNKDSMGAVAVVIKKFLIDVGGLVKADI